MRRRLELYHDLLTEQLRPRIEAAAAATAEAVTDNPDSDTDQCVDDNDTDDTDDTDSDEDLCEWEHAENESPGESCARVAQWCCGLERNGIWEDDDPDHGRSDATGSDQVDLDQQDGNQDSSTTAVQRSGHADKDKAVDASVQKSGGPLTPLSVALVLNHIAKAEEQGQADDGKTLSSGPETTRREVVNTVNPQLIASSSELSQGASSEKLTPPSSPCREASVITSPVSADEGNDQTCLGKPALSNHPHSILTTSMLLQSPRRSKSLPLANLLPSHCPPTPPPDTSSSSSVTSTYSIPRFTVTQAELNFFNHHIEQVAYMIRGIDYQFQMQEYRNDIRRHNRRKRRREEIEQWLALMELGNEAPAGEWSSGTGWDEVGWTQGAAGETEHQSCEGIATTEEWDFGALGEDGSTDTNTEEVVDDTSPIMYTQGGWAGETYGTDGQHEDDVDSIWPDDGGGVDEGWDSGWDSTGCLSTEPMEPEEKTQLHQPAKPSPLRMGYTPEDLAWEDAVAEANYLSSYGKRDEHGRRYWRL